MLFPGKRTDFAFWAKLCPALGGAIMTIIMTGKLRGEKTRLKAHVAGRGEGVCEVTYVIETRRVVVKLFYWQGKVVN